MEALGILEHCEKWSTSFIKLYTQKLMFKEITAFMFKNSRGCFSYKIINRLIIQCMIYYLQKDKILFHTHSLTHHTHNQFSSSISNQTTTNQSHSEAWKLGVCNQPYVCDAWCWSFAVHSQWASINSCLCQGCCALHQLMKVSIWRDTFPLFFLSIINTIFWTKDKYICLLQALPNF